MTRTRIITTDPARVERDSPPSFDAEFFRVDDLSEPPAGYPAFIEFPPKEWVGVRSDLDDLIVGLGTSESIAFGISDPALLVSRALADAVETMAERGISADIIVDLGD
jgi:hypothetical protein